MMPSYTMLVEREDGSFYCIDGTLTELRELRPHSDIYGEVAQTTILRRRPDW